VYSKQSSIVYYDILSANTDATLKFAECVRCFMVDEYRCIYHGDPAVTIEETEGVKTKWEVVRYSKAPCQATPDDCGVFVCMYAYCLHYGIPVEGIVAQKHSVNCYRLFIDFSIIMGAFHTKQRASQKFRSGFEDSGQDCIGIPQDDKVEEGISFFKMTRLMEVFAKKARLMEAFVKTTRLMEVFAKTTRLMEVFTKTTRLMEAFIKMTMLMEVFIKATMLRKSSIEATRWMEVFVMTAVLMMPFFMTAMLMEAFVMMEAFITTVTLMGEFFTTATLMEAFVTTSTLMTK
jgi:Ulp1 protease family, C-terminal catalytic domain